MAIDSEVMPTHPQTQHLLGALMELHDAVDVNNCMGYTVTETAKGRGVREVVVRVTLMTRQSPE